MAAINTTPTTTVQTAKGWFQGRSCFVMRQRVSCTGSTPYAALSATLPARARVIWAVVQNQAAIAVTGNDGTNTAGGLALVMHPSSATQALTAPNTATFSTPSTTVTNPYILQFGTVTAATGKIVGSGCMWAAAATGGTTPLLQPQNTASVGALITIQPYSTSSNRLQANGTSGMVFGTSTTDTQTSQADVTLYYEVNDDYPTF